MVRYVYELEERGRSARPIDAGPQFTSEIKKAREPANGRFQKALCYASYYVMAFSALCAFTPQTFAYAAEIIRYSFSG